LSIGPTGYSSNRRSGLFIDILKKIWQENDFENTARRKALVEEMEFFRQNNEILFRKLERRCLTLR